MSETSRARTLLFAATVTLLTGGLCLGLAEAMVRVVHGDALALFPRYVTGATHGEFHIRGNVPKARYRHRSADGQWEFRINGQGFRSDSEYSYAKAPGLVRILALGDSFTIGYEVSLEETFAAVMERALREAGIAAQVINTGVSGFSTAEELVFFENEGIRYDPDVVVLGFYENDLLDNARADLYRLVDGQLRLQRRLYQPAVWQRDFLNSFAVYRWLSERSYLFTFLNRLATLYVKRNQLGRNLADAGTPLAGDAEALERAIEQMGHLACALVGRIREIATQRGIHFILLDIPHRGGASPSLPRDCDVARRADAFVDGTALFADYRGEPSLYRVHGDHHWTGVAHAIVGRELARRVLAYLGDSPPATAR